MSILIGRDDISAETEKPRASGLHVLSNDWDQAKKGTSMAGTPKA